MKRILKSTVRKFFDLARLEVKRKPKDRIEEPYFVENQVVPNINTGVNKYGYHFCREDLLSFFTERDYEVTVITDEESVDPWGDRYLRFIACKK